MKDTGRRTFKTHTNVKKPFKSRVFAKLRNVSPKIEKRRGDTKFCK